MIPFCVGYRIELRVRKNYSMGLNPAAIWRWHTIIGFVADSQNRG